MSILTEIFQQRLGRLQVNICHMTMILTWRHVHISLFEHFIKDNNWPLCVI